MSFVAFIPARSGSTGIKNKNLVKINNKELIYWTINVAKQCKFIKILNDIFSFSACSEFELRTGRDL